MPKKPKEKNKLQTFLDYFSNIEDPRIQRNKLFPLDEILLVSLNFSSTFQMKVPKSCTHKCKFIIQPIFI